jgi:hypothetical protein
MTKFLMLLFLVLSAVPALATQKCQAYLFADDWADKISSVNDARDYCQKRMNWWGVDQKYFNDACYASKYQEKDSYGRTYDAYSVSFWWKLGDHQGQSSGDIFSSVSKFMAPKAFQGWPASVRLIFDPKCSDAPY